jgi:hypothetical protein
MEGIVLQRNWAYFHFWREVPNCSGVAAMVLSAFVSLSTVAEAAA